VGQHRRAAVRTWFDPLLSVNLSSGFGVEAPHNAAVIDDVKVFTVGNGSGHVGPVHRGPKQMRGADVAATAGPQCQQRPDPRRRVNDVVENYWGRDDPVRGIVIRIETVSAPEFLSRRRIVAGNAVSAGNHDLSRRSVT